MTSQHLLPVTLRDLPNAGNPEKHSIGYKTTRVLAEALNATQMGLAEAYIRGLEIPDSVFRSMMHASMPILLKHAPGLLAPYEWVLDESDRLAESARELMQVQYDLPQAMLNQMLGDWPTIYPKYSMGLWENGATDLQSAQIQMLDRVIEQLEIVDGDRILDFGCGWGCVPNYIMSKFPHVRFTGVNLSHQQCEYMRHKMQDPQSHLSGGRFTLIEGDLNEVQFTEKFDKILSIGVFCHIGNLTNALQKLASLLESNGKVFIHLITARIPNHMSSGFTHKYIFPHGRYWNYDAIPTHNRDLQTIDRWYVNGMNYHQTFTAWLQRFDDAQASVKLLDYGMDYAKFRRIWRFYLLLMGTAFATCDGEYNGNGQYLLTHSS
ncbi:SAM-dependent methyltransferase [Chamaesiphon minutus]|uniref:Methyltransferase, cyclopropane fatty acid synthase n=1 Tax=Chamaesiphon minutus (strain ATCC 27169 / PCC 6605) TaxID=1173020 RepID=K9U9U9_CHAP6|nr:class I SAM-dependent methyltransferase [Chamaesiphon minutus]AFY91862.1 methyltransferase, cyclopropane fatty acid synthase [Chamaesiphon minutus PCC 6605]